MAKLAPWPGNARGTLLALLPEPCSSWMAQMAQKRHRQSSFALEKRWLNWDYIEELEWDY